jgi:hypothetical protein
MKLKRLSQKDKLRFNFKISVCFIWIPLIFDEKSHFQEIWAFSELHSKAGIHPVISEIFIKGIKSPFIVKLAKFRAFSFADYTLSPGRYGF